VTDCHVATLLAMTGGEDGLPRSARNDGGREHPVGAIINRPSNKFKCLKIAPQKLLSGEYYSPLRMEADCHASLAMTGREQLQ